MLSIHSQNSYYYLVDEISLVAVCLKQLSISEINQLLVGPLFEHLSHASSTQLQRLSDALPDFIVTKEIVN